jgi:hypothetical protein
MKLVTMKNIRGVLSTRLDNLKSVEKLDDTECTINSSSDFNDDSHCQGEDPIYVREVKAGEDSIEMALVEVQHDLREKASQCQILRETLSTMSVKMTRQECQLQVTIVKHEETMLLLEEKTAECEEWRLKYETQTLHARRVEESPDCEDKARLLKEKSAECEQRKVKYEKMQAPPAKESLPFQEENNAACAQQKFEEDETLLQAKQVDQALLEPPPTSAEALVYYSSAHSAAINPLLRDPALLLSNHPWRSRTHGPLSFSKKKDEERNSSTAFFVPALNVKQEIEYDLAEQVDQAVVEKPVPLEQEGVLVDFEEETKEAPVTHQDQELGDLFFLAQNVMVKYFSPELDEVFNDDRTKSAAGSSPGIDFKDTGNENDDGFSVTSSLSDDSFEIYKSWLNSLKPKLIDRSRTRVQRTATKEAQQAQFTVETVEC